MFSRIIDIIVFIYTFPVRTWSGGCSDGSTPIDQDHFGYPFGYLDCESSYYREPDRVIGVLSGMMIYGFTAIALAAIVTWTWREISWRRKRMACQHCHEWTLDISDGSEPGCVSGQACCIDCVETHIDASVERKAAQEVRVNCPRCQHKMEKEIAFRTILDICDACGGVFLAPEELEYLEELATNRGYERGYDDGRSTGSSSSVAMGFVIGSAIG